MYNRFFKVFADFRNVNYSIIIHYYSNTMTVPHKIKINFTLTMYKEYRKMVEIIYQKQKMLYS